LGPFGFDYLLPDETRLRRDEGNYATALKAEMAAEERFKMFKLVKKDIATAIVICTQRRHKMAMEYFEKSLSSDNQTSLKDFLRSSPQDCFIEMINIVEELV
jgi:hypothetical protein